MERGKQVSAIVGRLPLFFINLPLNPSHNQRHNKIDLLNIQRPAFLVSMPFLNASDRDEKIGLNVYRYPD